MKIRITTIMIFLLASIISFQSKAQDPYFSQFYASPLQTNPAMIGVYEGQWRGALNYREQWSSIAASTPFRTISGSFDMRHRIESGDYVGFGFSALRDQVGSSHFTQYRGNLGISFLKQLGGSRYSTSDQYLIAGAQAGFGQNRLDWEKLWFSNQFDIASESVISSLPSGEAFNRKSTDVFLDMNLGLLWYALFDDNMSIYAGGAMHHINGPNVSLIPTNTESLHRKWVGQIGGEMPFTDELSILPAVIAMGQGKSKNYIFGTNFRYSNSDWREVAIRIGAWGHMANKLEDELSFADLIFVAILEMERWNLGLSYDVNTSDLSLVTNARGAFEISLIYTHPERYRSRVKCPNF
ncbi:MAG: type IX secretion system membrane protein PorP/SprF [Bacteroidetes bacterium]|nr:type IX secretion system membrane protein PorP/SprF [Bacteroidota bacterium]